MILSWTLALSLWLPSLPPTSARAALPSPWIFEETSRIGTSSARALFRTDLRRRGFVDAAVSPNLRVQYLQLNVNSLSYGASKSSPVIGDGLIFAASDRGELSAIDGEGRVRWVFPSFLSAFGFHGTPALWKGLVIAGDYAGRLIALDAATGRARWILNLGNSIGASPLITDDGKILISAETIDLNGFVARVDASTGNIEWLSDWLGQHPHSSPSLDLGRGLVVVGVNNGRVYGLDFKTGRTRWIASTGGEVKATAALTRDLAVVGSWDEHLHGIDLDTGRTRWSAPINGRLQGSVAVLEAENLAFFSTIDGLCKVNLKTGGSLTCERRFGPITQRQSSPVVSRSATNPRQYLVWSSCDERSFCAYDAKSLKRERRWGFKSAITNEALVTKDGVYLITNGEDGLVVLRPVQALF